MTYKVEPHGITNIHLFFNIRNWQFQTNILEIWMISKSNLEIWYLSHLALRFVSSTLSYIDDPENIACFILRYVNLRNIIKENQSQMSSKW